MISWSTQTGYFNSGDWFIQLLLGLIELGSAPDSDRNFIVMPVDRISQLIVEVSESALTVITPMKLCGTHMIPFKAIWHEICRQQGNEPNYFSLNDWYYQLEQRLDLSASNMLYYFRNIFENDEYINNLSTETENTIHDLNLRLFVKTLLHS